jgi:spore maturation protein CgeB
MKFLINSKNGNLDHSYTRYLAEEMIRAGHKIVLTSHMYEPEQTEQAILAFDGDGIIGVGCHRLNIRPLAQKKMPKVLWYMEQLDGGNEIVEENKDEFRAIAGGFDKIIFTDKQGEFETEIKKLGAKEIAYLYPVKFLPSFKPLNLPKKYDISFNGTPSKRRWDFMKKINKEFNVSMFSKFDLDARARLINQSKINLHISFEDYACTNAVNLRAFDVLPCGSFMLHDHIKEPDMFEDKKHLVYFNGVDDLMEKIDYYLEHEDEREKIAEAGRKYILEKYSIKKTIHQLLQIMRLK